MLNLRKTTCEDYSLNKYQSKTPFTYVMPSSSFDAVTVHTCKNETDTRSAAMSYP